MKRYLLIVLLCWLCMMSYGQRRLVSWSQGNIENYTKEMYDAAQKLTSEALLQKNIKDVYWSEVFLTLNASVINYKEDKAFLEALSFQITNKSVTQLKGTSRLIIWERISSGDILFEGKGIVIDNDLYQVAGRANQILQTLTGKNFGNVSMHSKENELLELSNTWKQYLAGKSVQEVKSNMHENAGIPEIASIEAIDALIVSIQESERKEVLTKDCLQRVYQLNEMPKEKTSSAHYCDPDTYTYGYLKMLFGKAQAERIESPEKWSTFWLMNKDKIKWNDATAIFEVIE